MAQFDQIVLFYNQLINMADEVHELINKELYDLVMDKLSYHDRVFIQIKMAKKCAKLTEEEQKEIDKLEDILREKEKENIELMQVNMAIVKKELNKIKIKDKVKKAYGQVSPQEGQGSIIDVDDSYRPENSQA